jgi:hypothetical protein
MLILRSLPCLELYLCFLKVFKIILLLSWGNMVTLTKVLTIYRRLNSHSPPFSCITPPPYHPLPHTRIVSKGHIFWHYIWVHNIPVIFTLLHPLLISSPTHTGTNPQTGAVLPFCSTFLEKKKKTFCYKVFCTKTKCDSINIYWISELY